MHQHHSITGTQFYDRTGQRLDTDVTTSQECSYLGEDQSSISNPYSSYNIFVVFPSISAIIILRGGKYCVTANI